jgi:hypothetical protein
MRRFGPIGKVPEPQHRQQLLFRLRRDVWARGDDLDGHVTPRCQIKTPPRNPERSYSKNISRNVTR